MKFWNKETQIWNSNFKNKTLAGEKKENVIQATKDLGQKGKKKHILAGNSLRAEIQGNKKHVLFVRSAQQFVS